MADNVNPTDGFLRSLPLSDVNALSLRRWGDESREPRLDEVLREHVTYLNSDWRTKPFDRLFPNADEDLPSPQDLEALRKRLYKDFEPLRKDRNAHRAHKFERGMKADATWLVLDDAVRHLKPCQDLLIDFRCLATNSQFVHHAIRGNPDEDEAQDIVDLILCGTITWMWIYGAGSDSAPERPLHWQRRQAYYERLHAAHDACGDAAAPFNDRSRALEA